MIIYTKYSNERRREFCIRTDIRMNDAKETYVCKLPAFPEAKDHIRGLEMACQGLQADLAGSGLTVNTCMLETEPDGSIAAHFPFCKGWTLEEKLDTIWKREGGDSALFFHVCRYKRTVCRDRGVPAGVRNGAVYTSAVQPEHLGY